jgi:CheY-like chemotaxis protein
VLTNSRRARPSIQFVPYGGAIELCVDVIDRPPKPAAPDAAPDAPAPPSRWLRFMVLDNGIGMDPAHLERIFLPFTQENSTTMREFGGTGLGLSICQRIVNAMGGTISAFSPGRNQGAAFTFTVPLRLPTAEQLEQFRSRQSSAAVVDTLAAERGSFGSTATQPPDVEAPPPGPSLPERVLPVAAPAGDKPHLMRVLVAEDDMSSQKILKMILTKMGCTVTCVNNGAAAVAAYMTDLFDLVISDVHMPVLDGLATSSAICSLGRRGERPLTPVVALSASCSPEAIQRCREAGMERHISKPVNAARLRQVLDSVRERSQSPPESPRRSEE